MNELAHAWDVRIDRLTLKLPARGQKAVAWLREPSRRWVRGMMGGLLVLGGIFSILPVLGLWMLPLGLALLAQDFPWMKSGLERSARWIEALWLRWKSRSKATEG